jgi:hypothetical protein
MLLRKILLADTFKSNLPAQPQSKPTASQIVAAIRSNIRK